MVDKTQQTKPGFVTLKLVGKSTGEKLRIIREELEEIYPGEFTLSKVAEKCDEITYHGLRKLELAEGEPRKSTVRVLTDFYNIPVSLIYESGLKLNQHFFLGKKEDMESYKAIESEVLSVTHQEYSELDLTEDGFIQTNDISIDISIRVYQQNTGVKIMENLIQDKVPFSEDDLDNLRDMIRQQVKVLSDYYSKLKQFKNSNNNDPGGN